jgi:hypothetical protein
MFYSPGMYLHGKLLFVIVKVKLLDRKRLDHSSFSAIIGQSLKVKVVIVL